MIVFLPEDLLAVALDVLFHEVRNHLLLNCQLAPVVDCMVIVIEMALWLWMATLQRNHGHVVDALAHWKLFHWPETRKRLLGQFLATSNRLQILDRLLVKHLILDWMQGRQNSNLGLSSMQRPDGFFLAWSNQIHLWLEWIQWLPLEFSIKLGHQQILGLNWKDGPSQALRLALEHDCLIRNAELIDGQHQVGQFLVGQLKVHFQTAGILKMFAASIKPPACWFNSFRLKYNDYSIKTRKNLVVQQINKDSFLIFVLALLSGPFESVNFFFGVFGVRIFLFPFDLCWVIFMQ